MPDALITLELDEDTQRRVEERIVRNCNEAVQGASLRDMILIEYDDQLEGRLMPTGMRRWNGASELNDPLTQEAHLELSAMMAQANRKEPKWVVEAANEEDQDKATLQEQWLTKKSGEYKIDEHLGDVIYNTLRDPAGVMYVGWEQQVGKVRERQYRDADDPDSDWLDEGQLRDVERAYEQRIVERDGAIIKDGVKFRVPDLADFYVFPSDSQSVTTADGICERMLLTENQLLEGVASGQYDEDKVFDLIKSGPTHSLDSNGNLTERRNQYDGTADGMSTQGTADSDAGFYECFLWFGLMPKLWSSTGDGLEMGIPEHYAADDVQAMICPARNCVFQLDISPYSERPYIFFYMIKRPNRLLGKGVCQLLQQLQDEANATVQSTIDGMNLQMSPVLIVGPDWYEEYNTFRVYPGAMLPEDMPNSIRPLDWGRNSEMGLELGAQLVQRGKGLVAARGYGEMQDKVRKAAEINNVLAAADAKFDFFLQQFQYGVAELGARLVALHLQFMGDSLSETFQTAGGNREITAQDLRGSFQYIPAATSSTATPEMRLQLDQAKLGVMTSYIQGLAQAPPQMLPYIWHAARTILTDLGERNPEAWIGPEPQPPPPPQPIGAGGVPPQIAALQAAGVNPAIIQALIGQAGGGVAANTAGAISANGGA